MLDLVLTSQTNIKLVMMTLLAVSSALLYWYVYDKKHEPKIYKILIAAGIILRIIVCLAFYNLHPDLDSLSSDVNNYYYPGVQKIIEGEIPYRDFDTRYSLFFLPLFVIPVLIWNSLGAIVLTMIAIEAGMIRIYLRWRRNKNELNGYRTAFLYLFSPISFYWVAVVGYNSGIIAFFLLLAIILAEKNKPWLAGIAAAGSFLFCKFIALMAWPGLAFYSLKGYFKRTVPMALSVLLPFTLLIFKLDFLHPLKMELGNNTGGNIWFIISALIPGFQHGFIYNQIPYPLIMLVFLAVFTLYLNRIRSLDNTSPDNTTRSIAFITLIFFIFMTLSIKSFQMYLPMILIFLTHLLVNKFPRSKWALIFLAYIGSITFYEVIMFEFIRDHQLYSLFNSEVLKVFILDTGLLAAYLYYILKCWNIIFPGNVKSN
ncbi:MAG: hypothetical protein H8E46_06755 [FCB group bacterium]|nr:hypothetical protein [FCB group bacterium]